MLVIHPDLFNARDAKHVPMVPYRDRTRAPADLDTPDTGT